MKNTINYLRTYRKNTHITQFDIAELLDLKDNSIVSRCETGQRDPNIEMLLVYHVLFEAPVESLVSNYVDVVTEHLITTIPKLIAHIKTQERTAHTASRIHFLSETLTRLTKRDGNEE